MEKVDRTMVYQIRQEEIPSLRARPDHVSGWAVVLLREEPMVAW